MSYTQLKSYFLEGMPSYMDDLIPNQIKQAWIRIAICFVAFAYILIHADDLPAHYTALAVLTISYLGLQIYTLNNVKKNPLSFPRMLLTPVFDAVFLSVAILVDGGQFSPLYLAYLAAIMGTGMRFGNHSLIYTQILSVIAFLSTCFYLLIIHQVPIDIPALIIQIVVLIILPRYTQRANAHANDAFNARKEAKSITFQLLDKSPLPAFIFQYNDHKEICINYVNQSLQDISPLPIEELIGYPIRSLFSIEDVQEVEDACESILIDETTQPSFYIRTQGKHGTLQLLGNVRSFDFNHRRIGICFLTDITQQQQDTLKMHQNMQEGYMSTLVAGIVHDFRNVLTSIMGTAEMMQFAQHDRKTMEDLELIIQASEQGSRMVGNLLRLGKASQLESNEEEEHHDVIQALRSIVNLLRIQLPESIPLTLDIPDDLPPVYIRLTQLEQILMNLINNAAEASPEGGAIEVCIRTGSQDIPHEGSQPAMILQVTDHGIGIAEENLHKVTKAFWTSRKGSGGTGLGLAMVQRIVRQHNGSFHIDSSLGQGTTITLMFPLMDQQATRTIKETTPALANHTGASSKQAWNILLVDDNHDVIQVHQHMLERMGHQVSLAHDGKEALACFQKDNNHFHCIITDFIMPHMDGIDLCQHIRQQDPSIPLLMITAFGENDKLQKCHELDIHMLSKPTSFQGFKQMIDMIQSTENL